jgi:MFS transporter, AAHS family, 4-hydroxybenzoate transporter
MTTYNSIEIIDLQSVIDKSPIGSLQWKAFVLCGLCVFMDGFDIQSIGYVAPSISEEWSLKPAALGAVFAAGLFGMMIGSAALSLLADRFGRRPLLIGATFIAGAAMMVTSQARDINDLMGLRFVTGLGLGSLIPNVLSLTSEYSPARVRTAILVVMGTGLTLGAAVGGGVAAMAIPMWGWRGLFLVAGGGSILLGMTMIFALPESLRLLALRQGDPRRMSRLLAELHPDYRADRQYSIKASHEVSAKTSVTELFRHGRALTTGILWIVAFMMLLDLYFLSSWLPTVVKNAGYPIRTAVLVGTMLQAGGIVGSLAMAAMVGRLPVRRLLVAMLSMAAIAIFSIGIFEGVLFGLMTAVFIAGMCTFGSQPGLNALSANYYPTAIRSTGIGWMFAFGRLGSITGPIIGGAILQSKLGNEVLFMFAAAPALIAAGGFWLIGRVGHFGETPSSLSSSPEINDPIH